MSFSRIRIISLLLAISIITALLGACSGGSTSSGGGGKELPDAFAGRETADVLDYDGMDGYNKEIMLVETSVEEMDRMIKDGESFVLFFSFADCPYCNMLIPYLNDAALDAGVHVGYINTRSNPEWMSNMDIDGYDTVVEHFAEWLPEDDDGKEHLYTPDTYFFKNGKVVTRHDGVTNDGAELGDTLTKEQVEKLREDLAKAFDSIG